MRLNNPQYYDIGATQTRVSDAWTTDCVLVADATQ
jgi:hypothetical protein